MRCSGWSSRATSVSEVVTRGRWLLAGVAALALAVPSAQGSGFSPDAFFYPVWTSDGTALVYVSHHSFEHGIGRVTLGGEISTVAQSFSEGFALSRDGELAAIEDNRVVVRSPDGSTRRLSPARVAGGVRWSPDGSALAFQRPDGRLATVLADGTRERAFAVSGRDPSWSPDGAQIAFASGTSIVVLDVATGTPRAVGIGAGPVWAPDSSRLAIGTETGMVVIRRDGVGPPVVIPQAHSPSWSRDGSRLVADRNGDLVLFTLTTLEARIVAGTPMNEATPSWSSRGDWIAYTNYNERPPGQAYQRGHFADVFVVHADGTGRRSLTGGCGVVPETDVSWLCLVNGEWSIPAQEARTPSLRVVSEKFPRAVRFTVNVTDGDRHVYGMPIAVRQWTVRASTLRT